MTPAEKGIYPNWVSDSEIIAQVLKEIIASGGRLPYSFVVNSTHTPDSRERMTLILLQMRKDKLIHGPLQEGGVIEIDIEGSRAIQLGYKKYLRIKKWDKLKNRMSRISILFFGVIFLGVIGLLTYFLLHYFKVL